MALGTSNRKYMDTDTGGGTRPGTNTSMPVKATSPYSSNASTAKKTTTTATTNRPKTTTTTNTNTNTNTTTNNAAKKTYTKRTYGGYSYGGGGGGSDESSSSEQKPDYTSQNYNNWLKSYYRQMQDEQEKINANAQAYQTAAAQNLAAAEAQYNAAYNTNRGYYDQLAAQNAQREANINNTIAAAYNAMMGNASEYYNNLLGTYNRSMDYINQGFNEGRDTSAAIRDEAQRLAQELYNMGESTQNRQTERDLRGQYISYMNGLRNIEQKLAAQGLNGGVTETSRLNALNGYEANRTDLEEARLQALGLLRQTQMQSDSQAEQAYLNAMANLIANRTSNYLGVENTRASGEQAYANMKNDAESNRSNQTVTAQNNFQNWASNLTEQKAGNENQYASAKYNLSNSKNDVSYNTANMQNQAAANATANLANTSVMEALAGVGKEKANTPSSSKKKKTVKATISGA